MCLSLIFPQTYTVDHQVPDSAATATAILCGVKTKFGTVGLGPDSERGSCSKSRGKNLTCLAERFQQKGAFMKDLYRCTV